MSLNNMEKNSETPYLPFPEHQTGSESLHAALAANTTAEPVSFSSIRLTLQAEPNSFSPSAASMQLRQRALEAIPIPLTRDAALPRAVSVPAPATVGGPSAPLTVTDALSFLDEVKAQFANYTGVYEQFLDIMKQFNHNQINTPDVVERISALFSGQSRLIHMFNSFLPPGYRIETPPSSRL